MPLGVLDNQTDYSEVDLQELESQLIELESEFSSELSEPQLRLDLDLAFESDGVVYNRTLTTPEDIAQHQFKVVKFRKRFNQTAETLVLPTLTELDLEKSE